MSGFDQRPACASRTLHNHQQWPWRVGLFLGVDPVPMTSLHGGCGPRTSISRCNLQEQTCSPLPPFFSTDMKSGEGRRMEALMMTDN